PREHVLTGSRGMEPAIAFDLARVPDELDPRSGRSARLVLSEEGVHVDVLNAGGRRSRLDPLIEPPVPLSDRVAFALTPQVEVSVAPRVREQGRHMLREQPRIPEDEDPGARRGPRSKLRVEVCQARLYAVEVVLGPSGQRLPRSRELVIRT